jgi:hypothetical protein
MTSVGPVSQVDLAREQRKEAPFRHLPDPPAITPKVTFTERDVNAHKPPPVDIPPPPHLSLQERLDLSRPVANTTALITVAMTASLPARTVMLRTFRQAQVRAYTT